MDIQKHRIQLRSFAVWYYCKAIPNHFGTNCHSKLCKHWKPSHSTRYFMNFGMNTHTSTTFWKTMIMIGASIQWYHRQFCHLYTCPGTRRPITWLHFSVLNLPIHNRLRVRIPNLMKLHIPCTWKIVTWFGCYMCKIVSRQYLWNINYSKKYLHEIWFMSP